jgi:hypothetical protein
MQYDVYNHTRIHHKVINYKRMQFSRPSQSRGNSGTSQQWHHAQKGRLVPFCERCLSCAYLIVTEENTLLLDDEVKMLVILRMNVSFMEFTRDHYGHVIGQQPWKMTIVD